MELFDFVTNKDKLQNDESKLILYGMIPESVM